jgi:hypothetical protein
MSEAEIDQLMERFVEALGCPNPVEAVAVMRPHGREILLEAISRFCKVSLPDWPLPMRFKAEIDQLRAEKERWPTITQLTAVERVGRERWEVQEADRWQVRVPDGTLMFATLNQGLRANAAITWSWCSCRKTPR